MPFWIKVAGADRQVSQPSIRVGGAWRPVSAAWIRVAGAWRQFYTAVPTLGAGLSSTTANGSGSGSGPFNTSGVQAQPIGGSGNFSYYWFRDTGSSFTLGYPDSYQDAYWTGSGTPGTSTTEYWRCRITDNITGDVAYTPSVTVTIMFSAVSITVGYTATSVSGDAFMYFPYTPQTATSTTSTASPTGGIGPFSYQWEYVSGDVDVGADNPNNASTSWSASTAFPGSRSAQWRCKITDIGSGAVAYGGNVSINLNFNDVP